MRRTDSKLYDNWHHKLVPHDYIAPFNIEILGLGVWESYSVASDYMEALYMASAICRWDDDFANNRVRIIDNNDKII